MIAFDVGSIHFSCRSAGVVLRDDRVLLQLSEQGDFWVLPGGRIELMESARDTLRREMREELAVEVQVERLLWIVEGFYQEGAQSHHELAFYHLVQLPEGSDLALEGTFEGREEVPKLLFRWHPVDTLSEIALYPRFLREALRSLPMVTKHIVNAESEG